VAAPVEICPPRDGVVGFGELPDPDVVGEHDGLGTPLLILGAPRLRLARSQHAPTTQLYRSANTS
jgi:hypothetical protein